MVQDFIHQQYLDPKAHYLGPWTRRVRFEGIKHMRLGFMMQGAGLRGLVVASLNS